MADKEKFLSKGEFTTGDYEGIMNKASCLSLVSNAILYWNTVKIQDIVTDVRQRGEDISDASLSHISLLPYKHVLTNGTYFIDDYKGDSVQKPKVSDDEMTSKHIPAPTAAHYRRQKISSKSQFEQGRRILNS